MADTKQRGGAQNLDEPVSGGSDHDVDRLDRLETAMLELPKAPPFTRGAAPVASSLRKAQVRAALFGKLEPLRIGRFILLEQLGAGAMGEIYAAYDDQLDRKVAIKLVKSGTDVNGNADERLLREAQTLAQVSHPNVVQIFEAGTYNGRLFIAMELVRGKTLSSWLKDAAQVPRAVRQREILRQFIAAGRGLEAAHAAGVAHRDFKPDNVLVGDDGRVRVVDFGLARVLAAGAAGPAGPIEPEPDVKAWSGRALERAGAAAFSTDGATIAHRAGPAASGASANAAPLAPAAPKLKAAISLTETGTVMGTPRFMSPEQLHGAVADQRSDQFSFSVALHYALYDAYPFTGDTWQELKSSMERGEIKPAPNVPVPASIRAALRRGLSVQPADRFASMGELLAALEPESRRLRLWLAAAAAVLAIALGAVLYLRSAAPPIDPCAAAGAAIDAPWSPERQEAVHAAFRRSELPFAGATWSGVKSLLDDYATRWRGEATAACRATHVAHTQSPQQLDKRMLCLDRGRRQLAALVAELGTGAPAEVERALAAAESLPALDTCSDPRNLLFGLEPPPPALAARVAVLRDQIARAFALELLGRGEESLAIARDATAAARGLGYPPVLGEALVQAARALYERGTADARSEGERLYFEALDIAEAERHDELAARIWHLLVLSAIDAGREQALPWWRRNEAAVRRLGDAAYEEAKLHYLRGELYQLEGKYLDASRAQRRAISAIERAPAHRLELARYYDALARSLAQLDQRDAAIGMHERALAIATGSLGAGHPIVVTLQANFGLALVKAGQLERAGTVLESALGSMSAAARASHRQAAKLHSFLSSRYYLEGRLDRAAEHGRASLEIHRRARSADADIAEVLMKLADIEFKRRAFEGALALYQEARALRGHLAGHPALGLAEGSIAETLLELGRYAEAMPHLAAAERCFEGGTSRGNSAWLLTVRGELLVGQRQPAAAIPVLERALALFSDGEVDPTNQALAMGTLARALHELGRDGDRVRSLAERALAIFTSQGEVGAHLAGATQRFIARLPAPRAPQTP